MTRVPSDRATSGHEALVVPGTEGYAEDAEELIPRYESVGFAEKLGAVLHLVPLVPCRVLDIGAGTGADASWLADRGHRVVAVEPTRALREYATARHPSPSIEWVDDSLPGLRVTRGREETFDLILITAVWMHLDEDERRLGMQNVASLLESGGVLIVSLRHGPLLATRRMFDVSADETVRLAERCGLQVVARVRTQSAQPVNRGVGVEWSRLAFRRASTA